MSYNSIIVSTKDFVTTITINRPPLNSVNLGIREELFHAVAGLEKSRETRAIIITGAGEKGFSAGSDISDFANAAKGPNGNQIMNEIASSTKPYIAAINGHALGGGCEIALACHFRLMTDNPKAFIGLPEVNLGVIPSWGGIHRLPRIVGKSKALDIILFSKRLSVQEALAIGLVDKVVPAAELIKEATALATVLVKRPPLAVAAVLTSMSVSLDKGVEEGLRKEEEWQQKLASSKDTLEGVAAFLEKRKPIFKGE